MISMKYLIIIVLENQIYIKDKVIMLKQSNEKQRIYQKLTQLFEPKTI